MERVEFRDKAAFGATCRWAKDVWDNYPFSTQDYGSTVLHRLPPPTLADRPSLHIRALITEKARPSCYDRCALDWVDAFPGETEPEDGGKYQTELKSSEEATTVLLTLAKRENFSENDHRNWVRYIEALRHLGREEEADTFLKKDQAVHQLVEAIRRQDFCSAEALVAKGTPLAQKRLSGALIARDDVRAWLVETLLRQDDQKSLNEMLYRFESTMSISHYSSLDAFRSLSSISGAPLSILADRLSTMDEYYGSDVVPPDGFCDGLRAFFGNILSHAEWSPRLGDSLVQKIMQYYGGRMFSPAQVYYLRILLQEPNSSIEAAQQCLERGLRELDNKYVTYDADEKEHITVFLATEVRGRLRNCGSLDRSLRFCVHRAFGLHLADICTQGPGREGRMTLEAENAILRLGWVRPSSVTPDRGAK